MQRPQRLAVPAMLVGGFSLAHGMIGIEERPRLDLSIHGLDAREAIGDQLGRGDTAVADVGCRLDERE